MKQLLRVLTRTKCRLWEVVFVSFVLGYLRQAYYFALQIYNAACEWFAKSEFQFADEEQTRHFRWPSVLYKRPKKTKKNKIREQQRCSKRDSGFKHLELNKSCLKETLHTATLLTPETPTSLIYVGTTAQAHTYMLLSVSTATNQSVPIQPRTHFPPCSLGALSLTLTHSLISSPARHNLQKSPAVCIWQDTFSAIPSATYFSTNNNRLKLQCIVSCYVSLLIGSSSQSQLLIQIFNSSTHFQTTHIQPTELTQR